MRQLTALDQQFLALEDSRHVGHVGALAILDPSTAPGGRVTLATGTGYTIGSQNSATVNINDNDSKPTVTVSASDNAAAEAGPFGGYTIDGPDGTAAHTIIEASNPEYQGDMAFEMLFHEASHARAIGGRITAAINAEAARHNPLEARRDALYPAFQSANAQVDPADPAKAKGEPGDARHWLRGSGDSARRRACDHSRGRR